jgi:cytochrome P450
MSEDCDDLRAEPPRFDTTRAAWILSRYADVCAAFRDTRLAPSGAGAEGEMAVMDEAAHAEFRQSAKVALSPARVDEWLASFASVSEEIYDGLEMTQPVDLVREFAEPWSLAMAIAVTRADPLQGERLQSFARDVFRSAAEPFDEALRVEAGKATVALAASLGDALNVQAFLALSQTLPCFLANAWLALLRHPAEIRVLESHPELVPNAVDELLRYATPSRGQFRRARCAVNINGTEIEAGQAVILMTAAANRDPVVFPEPERLDVRRTSQNHLAFGLGSHSCAGAMLVRSVAAMAMHEFLRYFGRAELCRSVEWCGGFAIRWPAGVWVNGRFGR